MQTQCSPVLMVSMILAVPYLLSACATRSKSIEISAGELVELKEVLEATEFRSCQTVANSIKLPVPSRNTTIQFNDARISLVYEGMFRESVKTVWQPLNTRHEIEQDGIVVGNKGMPFVIDFASQYDDEQGFWATYRTKIQGSERFSATVEYLPKNSEGIKVARVNLPLSPEESVQRIWIIPLPQQSSPQQIRDKQLGMAHVFVKSVSTLGSTYDTTEGIFRWYLVQSQRGRVKKMGEYKDPPSSSFLPERFLLTDGADDPTAVGLSMDNNGLDDNGVPLGNRTSRIVAARLFAPGAPSVTLHQEPKTLSSLAIHSSNGGTNSIYLAWIQNNEDATPPSIQYAFHKLVTSELRSGGTAVAPPTTSARGLKSKLGHKRENPQPTITEPASKLAVAEIKTGYVPSRLQFVPLQFQNGRSNSMILTWMGGTDTRLAFVASPMPEAIKSLALSQQNQGIKEKNVLSKIRPFETRTIAFTSAEDLGRLVGASISPSEKGKIYLTYSQTPKTNAPQPATIRLCTAKRSEVGR